LKLHLNTIKSSPSQHSYQKDERAYSGKFVTNLCFSPPSGNKVSLTSLLDFLFTSTLHLPSYISLYLFGTKGLISPGGKHAHDGHEPCYYLSFFVIYLLFNQRRILSSSDNIASDERMIGE
jgi:hypothetical protein